MPSILMTTAVLAALVNFSAAMPWLEPVQTPVGLMAAVGFSPMPTEAPGLGSIPKELLRKQDQVPYPPPANWCGFVGGNPSDVLSCSSTKACVYSGAVLGCCDAGAIKTCTNLFTTCANYGDSCNSACQANYNILKCSFTARPYCGTFAFDAGTRLYNCDSTQGAARSVEFLADYYLTAIGSQVLSSSFGPISITASDQVLSSSSRPSRTSASSVRGTPISNVPIQTNSPASSASADPNSTSHSGIGSGAIIGIAVGIVVVILAILAALIAWCCMRRRRRRTDPVVAPAPQMQQHQTQPQAPTYPPQQQPTYPPQQPTYPPQQPTYPPTQQGYFHPAADSIKPTFNNNTSTLPIPEADSTATTPAAVAGGTAYNDSKHDNNGIGPPRYSVANAGGQTPPPHLHANAQGVFVPTSDVPGAGDYHHNRPPHSPILTEVEGSSLYGHGQGQGQGMGQRPGLGQGFPSQGSGPISPLATGGTGMGTGFGQGQGYGLGQGQGQGQGPAVHEVDGSGRPVPGAVPGAGGHGQVQGHGQGRYGGQPGVYEIGSGEHGR